MTYTELEKLLEDAAKEMNVLIAENKSLRKTIGDRLSCCCSGCSRHNQNVMDQPCDEKNDLL
jgi:hypothetical protein